MSGTPRSPRFPEKREKITLVLHASVYPPSLYVSQLETFYIYICIYIYIYIYSVRCSPAKPRQCSTCSEGAE